MDRPQALFFGFQDHVGGGHEFAPVALDDDELLRPQIQFLVDFGDFGDQAHHHILAGVVLRGVDVDAQLVTCATSVHNRDQAVIVLVAAEATVPELGEGLLSAESHHQPLYHAVRQETVSEFVCNAAGIGSGVQIIGRLTVAEGGDEFLLLVHRVGKTEFAHDLANISTLFLRIRHALKDVVTIILAHKLFGFGVIQKVFHLTNVHDAIRVVLLLGV